MQQKCAVIRMALCCLLRDPAHGLTPAQVAWVTGKLADREWVPTPAERTKLAPVLLAWAQARQPQSLAVLERQWESASGTGP